MSPSPPNKTLPPLGFLISALALIGLALSLLLIDRHARALLDDRGALAFCGEAGRCDELFRGDFGAFLGIPLPFFALAYHLAAVLLGLAAGRHSPRLFIDALCLLSGLATAAALPLIAVMVAAGAPCALCLILHGLSAALLSAALVRRRAIGPEAAPVHPAEGSVLAGILLVVLLVLGAGFAVRHYLRLAALVGLTRTIAKLPEEARARLGERPGLGAPEAPLLIGIALDPLCGHCRRLTGDARILLERRPGRFRLSFLLFSPDRGCGRKVLAAGRGRDLGPDLERALLFAAEERRLEPFLDALLGAGFEERAPDIAALLRAAGLDPARLHGLELRSRLDRRRHDDEALAKALGVEQAPALIVGPYRIDGAPAPWLMEEIIAAVERGP